MNKQYKGIIFDLDGVLISTDYFHYLAWSKIAKEINIDFNIETNNKLRGVSRKESLKIILGSKRKKYTTKEFEEMLIKKNKYYLEQISSLSQKDLGKEILDIIDYLKDLNIKMAIGSSSRNAEYILKKIGIYDVFDAIITGNEISKSKPDPEVFTLGAKSINLSPSDCLVVEDADAGVYAALSGGFDVLGIGSASKNTHATFNEEIIDLNIIKKYIVGGKNYENTK